MTTTQIWLAEDIQSRCLTLIVDITDVVTKRGGWKAGERDLYTAAVGMAVVIGQTCTAPSKSIKDYQAVQSYMVPSIQLLPNLY